MIEFRDRNNHSNSLVPQSGASLDRTDRMTGIELSHSRLQVSAGRIDNARSNIVARKEENVNGIIAKAFEAQVRALAEIPDALDATVLQQAVATLAAAKRLLCFATGASALVVREAEFHFARLGLNSVAIQDRGQMEVQTALLAPGDAVLAFSHTGRNRQTVEGTALARLTGATIIGVTVQPDSPLTEVSDICLLLPKHNPSTSRICGIALINALAACIAAHSETEKSEANRCDRNIEQMLIQRVPKAA